MGGLRTVTAALHRVYSQGEVRNTSLGLGARISGASEGCAGSVAGRWPEESRRSHMLCTDHVGFQGEDTLSRPFATYLPPEQAAATPEDRAEFHAESARNSFIDSWTHRAMLARLGALPDAPTVVDVGCSAGYLLEDLRQAIRTAELIGVDLAAEGLRKAHENVPDAKLLQADVCELPLNDASADAVVSANVLEHVPDDERALAEISAFCVPVPGR